MPIYVYKCPECGQKVERIQNHDEAEPPTCGGDGPPKEGCEAPFSSAAVVFDRVIGKPNAHFNADNFHTTEYDDASNPASN